jgi:ATP-binding cassette subfamily F protein 3
MIRLLDITHQVGDRLLFSGLNWHVKPGERVGLVGDNGSGKTTLLRMMAGEIEPQTGEVAPQRGAQIGYLRQEIHTSDLTVSVLEESMKAFAKEQRAVKEIHDLYEQLTRTPEEEHGPLLDRIHALEAHVFYHEPAVAEGEARKILKGLGFADGDLDRPLGEFSGGWQMRAHMARLLLERPDLLMLDEPTNHLDLQSIEWLEEFLTGFSGALVVVSHDRYFLDRITTSTAWLSQRRLRIYPVSYSRFTEHRRMEEEQLLREYENQQREIAHIERFIERFRYKASKAASVQSRVKMLEKIERIELPPGSKRVRLRLPEPAASGRRLLELRRVGMSYGANRVLSDVNLVVERGDKIALVGRNGAGKSTLLKICAGVLDYDGERIVDPRAQIEYFSQHRIDQLNADNSVLEEARPPGAEVSDEALRSLLGCFLFTGDDVYKSVGVLSGGEKSRLAFARLLLRRGNLLLLDEPTNHLDIATREILQDGLRAFPGTIVMISHDRSFLDAIATKIVEVADGTARLYYGNYTDYLARKRAEPDSALEETSGGSGRKPCWRGGVPQKPDALSGALAAISSAEKSRRDARREASEQRQARNRRRAELRAALAQIEQEVERMEARLAEIHALQADPAAYSRGLVTAEIGAEAKALEMALPQALDQWEELSREYEELA